MRQIDKVERFLRAQAADQATTASEPDTAARRPFVTISRQTGAGAHEFAEAMVGVFARQSEHSLFGDWQVFDRELCELVASDPRFAMWLDSLVEEEYPSKFEAFFLQVLRPAVNRDRLFGHVSRVVRAVATIGKTIIIGRGGSEVTRGMSGGVSIRLVAPDALRLERLMAERNLDEPSARSLMANLDVHRARLVRHRFGVRIDDPGLYDITFSAGTASFDEMAEAVVGLLRCRGAAKQHS